MSSIAAVAGIVQGFDEAQAPGQVTILRMEGGTTLAPHCGPRNSRLTAHLPLVVPEIDEPEQGSRAGLRVGHPQEEGEAWRRWEEGQVLIFDDSFEHEARWPEATAEVSKQAVCATIGGQQEISYPSCQTATIHSGQVAEASSWMHIHRRKHPC